MWLCQSQRPPLAEAVEGAAARFGGRRGEKLRIISNIGKKARRWHRSDRAAINGCDRGNADKDK